MPGLIPLVLGAEGGVLAEPELCAAALDGDLHRLGRAFHPVDLPVFPAARAAALAPGLPRGAALDLDSAAWVHGARRTAPDPPSACVDIARRSRLPASSRHRVREVAAFAEGTQLLGAVLVTTPLRTALDLLRAPVEPDAAGRAALRLLVRRCGGSALVREQPRAAGRLPHKERALERLERLCGRAAQPPCTRYTS